MCRGSSIIRGIPLKIRKGVCREMGEEYGGQERQNTEQTQFRLNIDILEEQTGTSTTLGDQYGYNVFSEEFQESVENYEEKKEKEREEYIRRVFRQEQNNDIEEAFDAVFSSEAPIIVKAKYQEDGGKAGDLGFTIGFVIIGMFLTGILLFGFRKMRKERHKHAVDSYSDWTK